MIRFVSYSTIRSDRKNAEKYVLELVCELVKNRRLRVPSPDFLTTKICSPQWRQLGSVLFYQLPNKGKIVAKINHYVGMCEFDSRGLKL